MNKQDELREKVKYLHNHFGTPYAFIAKGSGVSKEYISRWINEQRNVSDKVYTDIDNFINEILEKRD